MRQTVRKMTAKGRGNFIRFFGHHGATTSATGQVGLVASRRFKVSSPHDSFSRGGCSMIQEIEHEQLSEERRKEIFMALVNAQDHDMNVAQSRSFVVQRFNVSENRVRQIEREGMDNKWPPLR